MDRQLVPTGSSRGIAGGRSRRRLIAVAVAAVGLVAAACGSSGGKSASTTTASTSGGAGATTSAAAQTTTTATPKRGGTLTVVKVAEQPAGWDPASMLPVTSSTPTLVNFAVYDCLFYEDASLKLVPRLAESMTTTDNGTTWTLKLRPNVKFSDGTVFDAAAVQFNWKRLADPATKALTASTAKQIASMTVVDPTTLQVTLAAPDLFFDHRVAGNLAWIASPTALQTEGANFGTHPVGAGPFIMTNWVPNSQYTFSRNPNYWETGQPYLDTLILKVITDPATAYNTFKAGGANATQMFDPQFIAQAKQDGFEAAVSIAAGGGAGIMLNTTKPPFNNPLARQIIDQGINRDEFNKSRRNGDPNFVLSSMNTQASPFYDPSLAPSKGDPVAAQKLVDQYVAQTGGPLSFTMNVFGVPYISQDAQQLAAQLSQLKNVDVKLNVEGVPQGIQDNVAGNFQAMDGVLQRWNTPAIEMVNWFQTGSSLNYPKYSNPQVDSSIKQLLSTADINAQKPLVNDILKNALTDLPYVFFVRPVDELIHDNKIQNLQTFFDLQIRLDEVWVNS